MIWVTLQESHMDLTGFELTLLINPHILYTQRYRASCWQWPGAPTSAALAGALAFRVWLIWANSFLPRPRLYWKVAFLLLFLEALLLAEVRSHSTFVSLWDKGPSTSSRP